MPGLPKSFMSKVQKTDIGCWQWMGGTYSNGYGRYKPDDARGTATRDVRVLAHRFAYEAMFGQIEHVINHKCENKGCVNPAHLEDVTQKENVHYSLSDTCKRGHDLTLGSPNVWIDTRLNKRKCRACNRENKRRQYRADPGKFRARSRAYQQRRKESP